MTWKEEEGVTYRIYRSVGDAPDYELIACLKGDCWQDSYDWSGEEYVMYKLTAQIDGERESLGAVVTINHATELYLARYNNWLGDRRLGH